MIDSDIEKKISNLVEMQFPQFYQTEGQNFVAFVKAYFEFMESEDNPLYHSRRMKEYTDIDDTVEAFLEHFQRKYLYGIPFSVIINKRTLLKHVLDVYRSKGAVQCYKLLFRLIYNQDVDVYLPGNDMLRFSDGTWKEPRYLEVSYKSNLPDYVGKTIYGMSSGTTAVVESFVQEPINSTVVSTLYISNLHPKGGEFQKGEKIILYDDRNSPDIADIISAAPSILGSVGGLEIQNGGQDFTVGDVLGVVYRDPDTNERVSHGFGAKLKVTSVARGTGQIGFSIINAGFGITTNANTFIYNAETDTTGIGADFKVGTLAFDTTVEYNTDLICDYSSLTLDAAAYGFPGSNTANATSNIGTALQHANATFGSLASLGSIKTGKDYTAQPYIFVRDGNPSRDLAGNLTFTTASANIVGTNTAFTTLFEANSMIVLKANASSNSEYHIVKSVTNATHMVLYDKPFANSSAGNSFKIAPAVFPSSFALYEDLMDRPDGSINGLNSTVLGIPGSGNNIVGSTVALQSGKGYVDLETVSLYLADGVKQPQIMAGGTGYANGDIILFLGGNPVKMANGYVSTNSSGGITSVTHFGGCGYQYPPELSVKSANGTGAMLQCEIEPFNLTSEVTGKLVKTGVGRERGYWTTTRGFLSSDKYIQDSYFYQDFSYQLQAAITLDKYRDILYKTFHTAGAEMFGKFSQKVSVDAPSGILFSDTAPTIS